MAQARVPPQNDGQQNLPEETGAKAAHETSTKEETQTSENPTTKYDDRDPSDKDAQAIVDPSTDEPPSSKPYQENMQAEDAEFRGCSADFGGCSTI